MLVKAEIFFILSKGVQKGKVNFSGPVRKYGGI
jgi:hypothetical protein